MNDTRTDTRIPGIVAALYAEKWAIVPHKLKALVELVQLRANGVRFSLDEVAERLAADGSTVGDRSAARGGTVSKSGASKIAVLPLYGVIAPHARMVNQVSTASGTSCEEFKKSFDAAMNDPDVSAIVIDVDSPGGSVSGVPELASHIKQSRGSKKIVAVANNLSASAAYWIMCAADELWCTPSGEVGSIGVFCIHEDASEFFANGGVKHTIIKAGDNKAEGNPYEPLSDDAKAYAQSQVDEFYSMFLKGVADSRGISIADVEEKFGQGRTVTARAAKSRGMVDKVGTMDDALAQFGVSSKSKRTSLAANASAHDAGLSLAAAASPLDLNAGDVGALHIVGRSLSESDRAATLIDSDHEHQAPHVGKEHTVDNTAAPSGAAGTTDASAILAADRKRAKDIRDLCAEHKVDDANLADSLIESGATVEAASLAILRNKRTAQAAHSPHVTVGLDREAAAPFTNFGEQLKAIAAAGKSDGRVMDKRLLHINAAASGMSEGIPSDGGFAVQTDFSNEIVKRAYENGAILSRVRKIPISANANGLKINAVDETSRATGSRYGGLQTYWANEADTLTASKPKFRQMELILHKLIGLWYLTDELSQDASALSAVAQDAFSEEITFMVEDAILNGNGSGQPLGVFNSSAVVQVAKESGQATGTVVTANLAKMFGRLWARSQTNAVWFVNQDVLQQLFQLVLGNFPVYMPPGGLSEQPYGTIFGRPVVPVEQAASLSSVGDINLLDLSQYLLIDKGGPQSAQSIHVRFLNDENTFRIVYRVDGQPIWNKALTPKNGSSTLSPFVNLQAR